jgi:hypothetical protein
MDSEISSWKVSSTRKNKISQYIVDETILQVGVIILIDLDKLSDWWYAGFEPVS